MASVVADTHSIVWLLQADDRLSAAAREALLGAIESGDRIYVSAISLVELVYLAEKRSLPVEALRRLIALTRERNSHVVVVPVETELAESLARVPAREISDMPDRMIAATAALLDLPLVTRDHRIIASSIKTIW